jgi:transcription initiation factor TFIID TATA-box-binding protein
MKPVSTMGSGDLGQELELDTLISELEDSDLIAESKFHGPSMVTLRLTTGGPAITIYRTGGFQVRGTEDGDALFKVKDELLNTLEEIGLDLSEVMFEQVNAVFLSDLNQNLNLEALALQLGLEYVEYEPEQFPGLIYRPSSTNVVLLVFASGKVIISGTTEQKAAEENLSCLQDHVVQIS